VQVQVRRECRCGPSFWTRCFDRRRRRWRRPDKKKIYALRTVACKRTGRAV